MCDKTKTKLEKNRIICNIAVLEAGLADTHEVYTGGA